MSESDSGGSSVAALDGGLKLRLSIMMFLQYAIWGAWLPLLWDLLTNAKGFEAGQVGNIFAVGACPPGGPNHTTTVTVSRPAP